MRRTPIARRTLVLATILLAAAGCGPAHLAGLQPGDFVLSINQVPATSLHTITEVIASTMPGKQINVEVLREQQRFRATAIAGELPDPITT